MNKIKFLLLLLITSVSFGQVIEFDERVGDATTLKHEKEYHVSATNGETDSVITGSDCSAFPTIESAIAQAVADGRANTGIKIILHTGTYVLSSPIVITNLNITFTSSRPENGGVVYVQGTLNFSHASSSCRVTNMRVDNIIHSGAGGLYLSDVQIGNSFSKTGTGYTEIVNTSLDSGSGYGQTGSGLTVIQTGKCGFVTLNNATGGLVLKDVMMTYPVTVTAGSLGIFNTTVQAISAGGTALTLNTGCNLTCENVKFLEAGTETLAKVVINTGSYYSFRNVTYNTSTSTISGTAINKASKAYFDGLGLMNVATTTGKTKGLVLGSNGEIMQQDLTAVGLNTELAIFKPSGSTYTIPTGVLPSLNFDALKSTSTNIVTNSGNYSGFTTNTTYECETFFDINTAAASNFTIECQFLNSAGTVYDTKVMPVVNTVSDTNSKSSGSFYKFQFKLNAGDYIRFRIPATSGTPIINSSTSYITFKSIFGVVPQINTTTYEYDYVEGLGTNIYTSLTAAWTKFAEITIPSTGIWNLKTSFLSEANFGGLDAKITINGIDSKIFPNANFAEYIQRNLSELTQDNVSLNAGDKVALYVFENNDPASLRNDEYQPRISATKVANFLPVVPTSYIEPEYATYTLASNDALTVGQYIGDNNNWSLDTNQPHAGNIAKTSDGFTGFAANTVYKATFYGDFASSSGTSYANWNFEYGALTSPLQTDRTVDRVASGGTQQVGSFTFVGNPSAVLKLYVFSIGTGAYYSSNSYIKIEAVNGKLPISYENPLQPQYLHAITNADQTVVTGSKITDFIIDKSNNINLSNGDISLKAGVTYELEGALNSTSNSAINYIVYQFRNNSNNVYLGNKGFFYPMNDTSEASYQHIAKAIFTPTVDTTVSLIVTSASATTGIIDASYGYIYVNAIAGQLPANQITEAQSVRTNADPATNITTPSTGAMAYDTTDNKLQVYNGSTWSDINTSQTVTGTAYYSIENPTTITVGNAILYPTLIGNNITSYVTVNATTGEVLLQPNAGGAEAVYEVSFGVGTFSTTTTTPGFVTYGFNEGASYVGDGGSRFSENYNSTYGSENPIATHTFFVSGTAKSFTPRIQTAYQANQYSVSVTYNYATQYKGKLRINKIK